MRRQGLPQNTTDRAYNCSLPALDAGAFVTRGILIFSCFHLKDMAVKLLPCICV